MTVPALPAASLVVIDDRPDLHVLLGRRRPGAFVGDMIVYPGGAVDDDDWRLGPALVPGATAPGLSAADAAAYLHAAIRETREEVGLFPDPNEVHDGTAYAAVGHWPTPEEVPRRYDTRFFLARHPGGEARVADDELVEVWWERPADTLARLATAYALHSEPLGPRGAALLTAIARHASGRLAAFAAADLATLRTTVWGGSVAATLGLFVSWVL